MWPPPCPRGREDRVWHDDHRALLVRQESEGQAICVWKRGWEDSSFLHLPGPGGWVLRFWGEAVGPGPYTNSTVMSCELYRSRAGKPGVKCIQGLSSNNKTLIGCSKVKTQPLAGRATVPETDTQGQQWCPWDVCLLGSGHGGGEPCKNIHSRSGESW